MERANSQESVNSQSPTFATEPVQPAGPKRRQAAGSLNEWQRFFLDRLDHLLGLQRHGESPELAESSLLSKAIYSTYLDCQSQGIGDQALQRITAAGQGQPSAN